jgi:hypothetical protein
MRPGGPAAHTAPTDGEIATDRPSLPARTPLSESVSAVISKPGICEPEDVIANRLDLWHGSWFHPYAFSHLVVDMMAVMIRCWSLT